jgi:hypothetical protein
MTESALITRNGDSVPSAIARSVFPIPVGPVITRSGLGFADIDIV